MLLTTSACALSSDGDTEQPRRRPDPDDAGHDGTTRASRHPPHPRAAARALPDDLRTRPAVAAAIADTAERAKVDPAQVVIAAWSPVTLTNGSLGCPQKGMSYTQALVEGELLHAAGRLRRCSSTTRRAGGPFAYCAEPERRLHRRRLSRPGTARDVRGPGQLIPGPVTDDSRRAGRPRR